MKLATLLLVLLTTFFLVLTVSSNSSCELQICATYSINVADGNIDGFHFSSSNPAPAADTDYIPMFTQMMIPGNNVHSPIAQKLSLLGAEVGLSSRAWPDMLSHSVLMTPLNFDVKVLNTIMLEQVPGNKVVYSSVDRGLTDIFQARYPVEIISRPETFILRSRN
ncbi:hypothetical protein MAM1_0006d00717 [Mucor ambiguus]|uniref:Uncharacterized protein n=1 Tax=Mucor ambiguus TaxID=91626 RepID=A0A0C9M4N9_9FUNG|nr:hypothetical protein MAM1_0006d00717 [Mucor ambiguus]